MQSHGGESQQRALVDHPSTFDATGAAPENGQIEAIWEWVAARVAAQRLPLATYRLQFNVHFTFRDAIRIVPWLARLGISHVYASPYLKATAGSPHGYDIVDHALLNPELGSEADFEALVQELAAHGLGQILDFVPNHMGVAGNDNAWWMDVLENGPGSPYASFFDIDWMPLKPDLAHKVLLPVLGDQFGSVLEAGQLVLKYANGSFRLEYFDRWFPIAPRSARLVLDHRRVELERELGTENPHFMEYLSILTALRNLALTTEIDPERVNERCREKEVIRRRLNELTSASPEVNEFLHDNLAIFNGRPGDPPSFDLLDQLLQEQAYRLSYWRVATDEINYRRFFDVNELAAICMENPAVFEQAHRLVFRLIAEGRLHGLRLDHADGLYDPTEYLREVQRTRFRQLCLAAADELSLLPREDTTVPAERPASSAPQPSGQSASGARIGWQALEQGLMERFERTLQLARTSSPKLPLYVVVEKVLEGGEELPPNWPVHGTTGYEFLAAVNGLFVDSEREASFDRIYARFIHEHPDFHELMYQGKKLILRASMSGEATVLGYQLDRMSERNRRSRDFTLNSLTYVLREIVACFPVYRTYITDAGALERDRRYVSAAVARAKARNPAFSAAIFNYVGDMLLLKFPDRATEEERQAQKRFVFRFQQFTGPVMAKGVEDTAYYRYNRLVSLNEVGSNPEQFGTTVATFHRQNQERLRRHAHSLLATSTHDNKRSEDVRARISALSEMPEAWKACVTRWSRLNKRLKNDDEGQAVPSRNDEYLLYQTLVGTWPLAPPKKDELQRYEERIGQYMLKAAREAKVHTSWISPSEGYEQALRLFVAALLDGRENNRFLQDLEKFASPVAEFGLWNSLSQATLKIMSPGVPDMYQGTELWDFTLVDPDNRRPIDFGLRMRRLEELSTRVETCGDDRVPLLRELIESRRDGRIKLYVISQLLQFRRAHPALLTSGEYVPLECTGNKAGHVCAFARVAGDTVVLIAVPRLIVGLTGGTPNPPLGEAIWGDARLSLPEPLNRATFRNVLTGETVAAGEGERSGLSLAHMFHRFPVATFELLRKRPKDGIGAANERE